MRPGEDAGAWATRLGISREAVELYLASDVIDLHVDSFIWTRTFGYDLTRRHGRGLFGARFYSQVDIPRMREAHVTGATWVVTTNVFRSAEGRARTFPKNLERLKGILSSVPDDVAVVRNAAEYRAARAAGKHGAFLGVQGGNAVDRDAEAFALLPPEVLRVTVVHLSNSKLGTSSAPSVRGEGGLSDLGRDYVRHLNAQRIFVDLAHIHRRGFFDALEVHDRSQPVLVTHSGVSAVTPSWRNLDDAQLRAVAELGGTVGVIYHGQFIGGGLWRPRAEHVVNHLEHICRTVGEDFASLGSDWDGAIWPPRDMPTCLELPVLVQRMLDRGFRPERVQKILGGNFLRVVAALRG